ncbi:hypothetical protein BDV98DRAFT_558421 [Pterulicium gracile]|uniref:Uncharacterized protein n=1 Tax=Pterulicium gracile TaxID=1884261 RepID=A0A5C3R248_9AGAR|nr:hypothetical protein BDV98DRAFT_558421 [Pterula gracilis]
MTLSQASPAAWTFSVLQELCISCSSRPWTKRIPCCADATLHTCSPPSIGCSCPRSCRRSRRAEARFWCPL